MAPVQDEAASESSHRIALAASSGWPACCSGTCATARARRPASPAAACIYLGVHKPATHAVDADALRRHVAGQTNRRRLAGDARIVDQDCERPQFRSPVEQGTHSAFIGDVGLDGQRPPPHSTNGRRHVLRTIAMHDVDETDGAPLVRRQQRGGCSDPPSH